MAIKQGDQGGVRRRRGAGNTPSRSVRVSDPIWKGAQKRAAGDGVSTTYVIQTFLEAYGGHVISLPRREVVASDGDE